MRARRTKSRFASKPLNGRTASLPPFDHPALSDARTIYPSTVRTPRRDAAAQWALKGGENSAKIGGEIVKGRWRGLPVYTLSLEERATCPRTCSHWRSCYGNHMQWTDRVAAGPDLEWRLEREVAMLEIEHGRFVVRLHVLGDFYSVEYVELWCKLLERHAGLHVWGYSARHDQGDPIAAALLSVVRSHWDRFAVRFSNAPQSFEAPATISVEHPYQIPADAILCPEQVGRTESCSTCGLCWQTERRVAFIQH